MAVDPDFVRVTLSSKTAALISYTEHSFVLGLINLSPRLYVRHIYCRICSAILRSHFVCRSKGERELLALHALSH